MLNRYGWSYRERYLLLLRLNTSLKIAFPVVPGFGSPISEPISSDFDQVKVLMKDRPCERRLVALTCSESNQLLPSGSQYTGMVVNWGNGRKAWARSCVPGKPA